MKSGGFDEFSRDYDELLRDPVRDWFGSNDPLLFHYRRRDLILRYFNRRSMETAGLDYLDLGCGRGELLGLVRKSFLTVTGCDPSAGMLKQVPGILTRFQADPLRIPFGDAEFDFVTAAGVYHHVPPSQRVALSREVRRVLRPGGTFCIFDHNPLNPLTRLIVSRTPVDADAVLMPARRARAMLRFAGFAHVKVRYFLFFPEPLFRRFGRAENLLRRVPFGGQYALFARIEEHGGAD